MGGYGTVPLRDLWKMLEKCAPGYTKRETQHFWRVMWNEFTYPSLQKGAHGRRASVRVELGEVKQLVRQFKIEECAATYLPQLPKPKARKAKTRGRSK